MHCYISLCLIEPLLMRWCSGSLVLFFCLEWGRGNKLCIRGHASKNKPDRLPLHIHVSRSRFIASWHNVRTINVSYVARLSHYRDSLTCCSFKYKMYTAPANKTFWVCGCPLWRVGGVCSQSPALIKLEGVGAPRGQESPLPTPPHRDTKRGDVKHEISASQPDFYVKKKKIAVDANWILIVCVFLAAVGIRSRRSHQFCLPLTPLVIVRRRHM